MHNSDISIGGPLPLAQPPESKETSPAASPVVSSAVSVAHHALERAQTPSSEGEERIHQVMPASREFPSIARISEAFDEAFPTFEKEMLEAQVEKEFAAITGNLRFDKDTGTYFKGVYNTGLTPESLKKLLKKSILMMAAAEKKLRGMESVPQEGLRISVKSQGHKLLLGRSSDGIPLSPQLSIRSLGKGGAGRVREILDLETGSKEAQKTARPTRSFSKDILKKSGSDTPPIEVSQEISSEAEAQSVRAQEECLIEYNNLLWLYSGETKVPESIQPMPEHKFLKFSSSGDLRIGFSSRVCEGSGFEFCKKDSELYRIFHANTEKAKILRQNVGRGLLEGMVYAHSRGLFHLDLKPQNCLAGRFNDKGEIDEQNGICKVFIADWGGARQVKDFTPEEWTSVGTQSFCAVEDFLTLQEYDFSDPKDFKPLLAARDARGIGPMMLMMLNGWDFVPYPLKDGFPDLSPEAKMADGSSYEEFQMKWVEGLKKTFSETQSVQLAKLFKEMQDPDWTLRPTMEEALKRYNKILSK